VFLDKCALYTEVAIRHLSAEVRKMPIGVSLEAFQPLAKRQESITSLDR
jgi:hypothetical protein